jgi:hypothetical protein
MFRHDKWRSGYTNGDQRGKARGVLMDVNDVGRPAAASQRGEDRQDGEHLLERFDSWSRRCADTYPERPQAVLDIFRDGERGDGLLNAAPGDYDDVMQLGDGGGLVPAEAPIPGPIGPGIPVRKNQDAPGPCLRSASRRPRVRNSSNDGN